jgi:hypothetical protein
MSFAVGMRNDNVRSETHRCYRAVEIIWTGEVFMQYLVEANRGPLPASPAEAIQVLEGIVIPH